MFRWFRRRQKQESLLDVLERQQKQEAERWWDNQVKAAVEESQEIDLMIFHDFQETEVIHFQSLEQERRVLPPTMVVRPRNIL